jgi:hypothetical protein
VGYRKSKRARTVEKQEKISPMRIEPLDLKQEQTCLHEHSELVDIKIINANMEAMKKAQKTTTEKYYNHGKQTQMKDQMQ